MKTILLFGAGKSATVLIDYLVNEAASNNWHVIIADADKDLILSKTNNSQMAEAVQLDIMNDEVRSSLVEAANIVISMMPPSLHFLIAKDCVQYGKNLLTASYLDDKTKSLQDEIERKGLLFICEMGLDPGIDHMSAMKLIDGIRLDGGTVTSFKSHCGGLVAPESDDNPWHYKISWNPRNVVLAGKAGAEYKLNNQVHHKNYSALFKDCAEVDIDGLGRLAFYPNRDSLSYIPLYKLESASSFLRTTLRYPAFCIGWSAIVRGDLANDMVPINTEGLSYKQWSAPVLPFVDDSNRSMFEFLGLFSEDLVVDGAKTSADILQYLLETKLSMKPSDKDMVVMLHEIEWLHKGMAHKIESRLIVTGENSLHTAMAKTVGLPLGITAKLILDGTIDLTGLHIPILKEIYEPVLEGLEMQGIKFKETHR
ncbi:MAG: saccharopine dehydrogenase C-terminal domain-containing protein [Ferruginibacter sp.]